MRKFIVKEFRTISLSDLDTIIGIYCPNMTSDQRAYAYSYVIHPADQAPKQLTPWAIYHVAHHIAYCAGKNIDPVIQTIMQVICHYSTSTFSFRRTTV